MKKKTRFSSIQIFHFILDEIQRILLESPYTRNIYFNYTPDGKTVYHPFFHIGEETFTMRHVFIDGEETFSFTFTVIHDRKETLFPLRIPKKAAREETALLLDKFLYSFESFIKKTITELELYILLNHQHDEKEYQEKFIEMFIDNALFKRHSIANDIDSYLPFKQHMEAQKKQFQSILEQQFPNLEQAELTFKRFFYIFSTKNKPEQCQFNSHLFQLENRRFSVPPSTNATCYLELFSMDSYFVCFIKKYNFSKTDTSASVIESAIFKKDKLNIFVNLLKEELKPRDWKKLNRKIQRFARSKTNPFWK